MSRFQKNKLIFIGIYFLFNLIILIVSFRLSLNNIRFLVDVSKMIPYAKYVALLGMILFFILILIHYIELRRTKTELNKNIKEVHVLKSRLYDLEEKDKKNIQQPESDPPENK